MSWRWFALLAVAALNTVACDDDAEKRPAADAGAPDAGPDPALMDPKIADALKSARPMGSLGIPGEGPPPNGIFAPGGADKAHAKGAPVKITLLEKGSEPRINLRPKLALDGKKTLTLQVVKRVQQSLLPNVDYVLDVQIEGGKAAVPEEGAAEPAPAPTGKSIIKFTVSKAKSSQRQMAQLPPDFDEKVAGLKGTTVRATLEPDGSISNESVELGKETHKALAEFANALQEVLSLIFSPWPDEPVGKGAFWLASDRTMVGGMDVVRYRHTTVEEIEGGELALSLNVRLYSAKQPPPVNAGQQNLPVIGFESFGKAVFVRKTTELLPTTGQAKVPLVLQVSANPQQPEQRGEVTIETAAAILAPAKKEGAPPDQPAPAPAPAPAPPP